MQSPVNQTCTEFACLCSAGTDPSTAGPTLRVAVCCWAGLTWGEWIKINLNLMVGIPKWSFKSIWRGKSYFLRPFMALNCLSSSPSPFYWSTSRQPRVPPAAPHFRLDCLCDLRGSLLWAHLARPGAEWAVLLQIQCLNIPKEWNLQAFQAVRSLLNTARKTRNIRTPRGKERPPLLRLPGCKEAVVLGCVCTGLQPWKFLWIMCCLCYQRMLVSPLPFLQKVGVKLNSHNENSFSKNV